MHRRRRGPSLNSASPSTALSDADDVYFSANGTKDSSCAITQYQFNFGDGVTSVTTYPYAYHYFHATKTKSFTVVLSVSDCSHTTTKSIVEHVVVDTPPVAKLNVTYSSSNPNEVYADASGSTDNAEASPYEVQFDWGDQSPITTVYAPFESSPHMYTATGSYTVTATVFDYAETASSPATQDVTVPQNTPAAAPSNVAAVSGQAQATVSWSAPASGTPSSYIVTATPGGETVPVAGNLSTAIISGLTNGTSYTFTVGAKVGSTTTTSLPSNPATPNGTPGVPTAVAATPDDTSAVVSWKAPAVSGGSPLSHHQGLNYIVTNVTTGTQTMVTGTPAPTSVTIGGLTNNVVYKFTVAASNSGHTGASSAVSTAEPIQMGPSITEYPHWKLMMPPSQVGTSATNLQLPLTIDWAGQQGATPICSYTLQHSLTNRPWVTIATEPASTTTTTDTVPASQLLVRYQVRATDCNGLQSAWVQSPEFEYQLFEENNATKFTFSDSDWTWNTCASCAGGHEESSTAAGAVATLTLNAAYNVGLVFSVGPTLGMADIKVDEVDLGEVNTNASAPGYRQLMLKTGWSTFGAHLVTVTNLGTPGHSEIDLDGAAVLYAPLARL